MAHFVGSDYDSQRIMRMNKERDEQRAEYERLQEKIKKENKITMDVSKRFSVQTEGIEEALKQDTVGLISSAKELKEKRARLEREFEERKYRDEQEAERRKKVDTRITKSRLSFADDEVEDEEQEETEKADPEETASKRKKLGKNPFVETHFLPDRDRDEEERREVARLKQEWIEEQNRIKNEPLEVTYSYWDGSGHRRTLDCTKGTKIQQFLAMVQQEFKELRGTSVDNLMFVKEDLIIQHDLSFYDLIVNKARGKSGPLYHFDVHDDVRLRMDATREKDEAHAAKVVERHWFEKNKHIFPASRWEVYDPSSEHTRYTIRGGEVRGARAES